MIRLETQALALAAGNRTLCHGLSVAFRAGENWAILGANGSGKTTLLHTLAGLRAPDGGRVTLDGTDVGAWPARQRALQIGLLFQDYALSFPATVLDTVLTGRHPHVGPWALDGEDDVRCARATLAEVGLAACADRLVSTLSGGERRRVEIAAVLAQDTTIGLWDEPVSHLDLRHRAEIMRRLAARAARPGSVNLFVLHDINAARELCSHALLLFPSGETRTGPAQEVITTASLERVYECSFRELIDGNLHYFLPR